MTPVQLGQRLEDAALRRFPWFTNEMSLMVISIVMAILSLGEVPL